MRYKDRDWLIEQYKDKNQSEIAEMCGVSRSTITRWMDKHNIDTQRGYQQAEGEYKDAEWLEEEYVDERKSLKDIGDEFGVSKETIKYWLKKHDIPLRSRREGVKASWEGAEERKERQRERFEDYRQPWWEMDEETQQRVRERFSEWWSENNPMEGKTKEQNPAWKGGGNRKYYGPNWEEQREKALERDDHACHKCGSEEDLVVHHHVPIRHWRNNDERDIEDANQLWNLVTLCETCHGKVEGNRFAKMGAYDE